MFNLVFNTYSEYLLDIDTSRFYWHWQSDLCILFKTNNVVISHDKLSIQNASLILICVIWASTIYVYVRTRSIWKASEFSVPPPSLVSVHRLGLHRLIVGVATFKAHSTLLLILQTYNHIKEWGESPQWNGVLINVSIMHLQFWNRKLRFTIEI